MPPINKPRPEAITTAKWWADVLRELVVQLQPTTKLSAKDVPPGKGSQTKRAAIDQAKSVVKLLTPQRIDTFQHCLAEIIETKMWADRSSFCDISQPRPNEYRNDEALQDALQQAGIDPFPFGGSSIFPRALATMTQPGHVEVIDHKYGIMQLKIVTE